MEPDVAANFLPKLTKAQAEALARVAQRYDNDRPLYAPGVSTGTRELSWAVKCALVGLKLVESFDWRAQRDADPGRYGGGATPPFIYYRPTPLGRASVHLATCTWCKQSLQDGDKILLTNQDEPVGNGLRIIRLEMPDAK